MKKYLVLIFILFIQNLYAFDGVRLHSGTSETYGQVLSGGVWTPITFSHELWDTKNYHSNSVDTSRITITDAGIYIIIGNISCEKVAAVDFQIYTGIRVNGSTLIAYDVTHNVIVYDVHPYRNQFVNIRTTYYLNSGDYVELCVYPQGSRRVYSLSESSPVLIVMRLE